MCHYTHISAHLGLSCYTGWSYCVLPMRGSCVSVCLLDPTARGGGRGVRGLFMGNTFPVLLNTTSVKFPDRTGWDEGWGVGPSRCKTVSVFLKSRGKQPIKLPTKNLWCNLRLNLILLKITAYLIGNFIFQFPMERLICTLPYLKFSPVCG